MVKKKIKKLNSELKKHALTAIVAAFGFLMALSWRDAITEYVDTLLSISPVQGRLVSASVVTLISVLGILIFTKLLDEKVD